MPVPTKPRKQDFSKTDDYTCQYLRRMFGFADDIDVKAIIMADASLLERYYPSNLRTVDPRQRERDAARAMERFYTAPIVQQVRDPECDDAPPLGHPLPAQSQQKKEGAKSGNKVLGVYRKHFAIWAGTQGWTPEEVLAAFEFFGVEPLAVSTIEVYLEAAEVGDGHRFWVPPPKFSPEQVAELNKAAGK